MAKISMPMPYRSDSANAYQRADAAPVSCRHRPSRSLSRLVMRDALVDEVEEGALEGDAPRQAGLAQDVPAVVDRRVGPAVRRRVGGLRVDAVKGEDVGVEAALLAVAVEDEGLEAPLRGDEGGEAM